MQFDTTYLTEAGRSLATGTLGGLDKIQFTRAVASSHDYSATPVNDLKKLTSIEDVQQTVEYSRIIKKDDTTLTMRVDFPSKDVTTAYSLYTVGFYARPENGDEILYGVLPSSLPDYIAAYDGKSNLNDSFQTDTTVSDADNVLITVSQAGSLNEADLDAIFASKHIATIDDIKANIPATVIDGSKPADFKESVTLEKGAVDGAGNAIATTKNLADGDATTLKSAKAYADTQASDKVKNADTANWQKAKISADDGSPKSFLYAKDNGNVTMWIAGRPLGIHTFWCAAGVTGNPVSSSIQGTMSISSVKNGVGYCVSADGDFISITLVDGQVSYSVLANAANVVDRNPDTGVVSKPTDFTNLTVNGGKSVATSDDLKSLEASAWRVLDNKYITAFTKYNTSIKVDENSLFLVKIDEVNKRVYMFFTILGNFVENSSIYIDLTSIVKNLSFPSYHLYYLEGNTASSTADGSIVGNRICFKIQIYDTTVLNSKYSSYMVNANDAGWIYSSCFVSYDELV
ncbi:hypothetical protein ACN50C_10220 [Levilactobacillus brevis]|uniref:hypothetical protein n=1 Tax=Levilactobacillus brevis TaxID=1580 RepID=UPI000D3B15C7|nr:hypothetical protein [Levilactobacillus brevis]PUD96648.1 hypothetical protein DA477_06540 [Levilactobacillus brevis]ULH73591.1 hypothetical protein MD222_07410 [Levilactobacillus brevis]